MEFKKDEFSMLDKAQARSGVPDREQPASAAQASVHEAPGTADA